MRKEVRVREALTLPRPRVPVPLDPSFRPAALALRSFREEARASRAPVPLAFALERPDGSVSRYDTVLFPAGHPRAPENPCCAERIFKTLLWQRGGHRAYVGGPREVGEYIAECYSPHGERKFDWEFMGEIYGRPLEVEICSPEDVPGARERAVPLGGHLDGCRIGFDLGASDIKVAAVADGKVVYSEEIVWEPSSQSDPEYHYRHILHALRKAAAHLPRVDAIGGSAAGVYVDNRVRVASLFRGVPRSEFHRVRDLFVHIGRELGVPLVIVNDGEVAALAGALSLETSALLGIALGSSEAGGYVTPEGKITNWLNELAFVPIDYNPDAPEDDWSGDRGCGAQYLSQQCVFRLAERVGIELPHGATKAERLRAAQERLEAGDGEAQRIWETMGVYLGYAIALYAEFYRFRHVLLLGRCTSGKGGEILLEWARRVLELEFPELFRRVTLHLPDERSRRVGQAVAAASLPTL